MSYCFFFKNKKLLLYSFLFFFFFFFPIRSIVTDEKADIVPTPTSSSNIRTVSSPLDAALNMIRDMFPKNLVRD